MGCHPPLIPGRTSGLRTWTPSTPRLITGDYIQRRCKPPPLSFRLVCSSILSRVFEQRTSCDQRESVDQLRHIIYIEKLIEKCRKQLTTIGPSHLGLGPGNAFTVPVRDNQQVKKSERSANENSVALRLKD